MRLDCWTQVGYRMMEAQNPHSKKAAFTVLVLSRAPARDKLPNPVTFILVCTSAKPSGSKYRVNGNIERLFTNFVDDGKATIRIREPMHDLIISKADVAELREFLGLLRRVVRGERLDESLFSAPPGKVLPAKSNLTVRSQRQYPASGFPRSLRKLAIRWCGLTHIGRDVLALKNLAYLNVNDNRLETLPRELNSLPLRQLVAVGNEIKVLPDDLFKCRLRNTLEHLDLSSNQLTLLPDTMSGMPRLTGLVAIDNLLKKLPDALGFSSSLCFLDVTNNELTEEIKGGLTTGVLRIFPRRAGSWSSHKWISTHVVAGGQWYLPATLMKLALDWISVWGNPMSQEDLPMDGLEEEEEDIHRQPLSLVDLAAQATLFVKRKRRLTAEDLPATLLERLRMATPCHGCKRPVLLATAYTVTSRVHLRMTTGPTGLMVHGPIPESWVPMQALLCSPGCLRF